MKQTLFFSLMVLCLSKGFGQCNTPTSANSSPTLVCVGGSASLSAISAGNSINWYTVATCGVPIGTVPSGTAFVISPTVTTTYYAESHSAPQAGGTMTFNFTGCTQTLIVPAGVSVLTVDVRGARGGDGSSAVWGPGANGGRVTGTIAVTPGQTLHIEVGGAGGAGTNAFGGTSGYNGGGLGAVDIGVGGGGGGGGASDIRSAPYGLANRLVVGGGGGGGGFNYFGTPTPWDRGGRGGTTIGEGGYSNNVCCPPNSGGGGTQVSGGGGGAMYGCMGAAGVLGIGGDASQFCSNSGGGGGGGYYGGGAGAFSGGGGGSNYLSGGVHSQGFQTGNGQVIITGLSGCTSANRASVTVSVTNPPTITISGATSAICPGSVASMTANGGISYTWSTGANTSTIAPTVTANVTYTVTGANLNCSATAIKNVTVAPATSVAVLGSTLICGSGTNILTGSGANTYTWSTGATTSSISVSPTVTTAYSVSGTSSVTGCVGNKNFTVTVSTNPSVSVNSGTICSGDSFTMMPTGAASYTYEGGSAVVSPTANSTYSVIGSNTAGCVSQSAVSNVMVNDLPAVAISASSNTICINESATLTASGADNYSWNTGDNTSVIVVSPTVNTSYTTTGTSAATGCSGISTFELQVFTCTITALANNASELKGLSVYPNPGNGDFSIELNNGLNKIITVSDYTGKQVLSFSSSKDKIEVSLSALPNGIYHVKIQSNKSSQVIKVVKQ